MRLGALLLLCGLSTGCSGSGTPATTSGSSSSPTSGGAGQDAPAAKEPEEQGVKLRATGKVLTARESPQNKAKPSLGGHWILEVEIDEWSAEDERDPPSGALRLIVPKEIIEPIVPRPVAGERVELVAELIAGKDATATADALSRL